MRVNLEMVRKMEKGCMCQKMEKYLEDSGGIIPTNNKVYLSQSSWSHLLKMASMSLQLTKKVVRILI